MFGAGVFGDGVFGAGLFGAGAEVDGRGSATAAMARTLGLAAGDAVVLTPTAPAVTACVAAEGAMSRETRAGWVIARKTGAAA